MPQIVGVNMPIIVFDSRTGNVKRFVDKLNMESIQISEGLIVNRPFILITYTTGFGTVPEMTIGFLQYNHRLLKGVAVSGNRNWGSSFGRAGDTISETFGVPLLCKFELAGTNADVKRFKSEIDKLD